MRPTSSQASVRRSASCAKLHATAEAKVTAFRHGIVAGSCRMFFWNGRGEGKGGQVSERKMKVGYTKKAGSHVRDARRSRLSWSGEAKQSISQPGNQQQPAAASAAATIPNGEPAPTSASSCPPLYAAGAASWGGSFLLVFRSSGVIRREARQQKIQM